MGFRRPDFDGPRQMYKVTAATMAKRQRCHSSQPRDGQSTVENASKSIGNTRIK